METVQHIVIPSLCDLLTGFGLSCILQFSTVSPDAGNFFFITVCSILTGLMVQLLTPTRKPCPTWLMLCNSTFSLLITLSLCLNLLSQLSPPREFALIPCYVLICIARTPVSHLGLLAQCTLGVLVCFAFALLPTSRQARPEGTDSLDLGGAVELSLSILFTCLFSTFDTADKQILYYNKGMAAMVTVLLKGGLLLMLGMTRDTSLYHFMFERENTVSYWLFVAYGSLLVFASMQTAAQWFGQLKLLLGRNQRTVIRLQHILYAILLAAAWAYPLQLHLLRSIITALLLSANLVYRWT